MKREFLEGLGLEKDVIDKIMTENGKDINNAKGDLETKEKEVETLQGQLETANKEIESYKEMDIEGIKAAADDYKTKFEETERQAREDMANLKFEHELEGAIRDSKAKNVKAVKALLDIETLRDSNNRLDDIKKALEETKTDNGYLFGIDEPKGTGGSLGAGGKNKGSTGITKEDFNNMGYMDRLKLKNKDPETYKNLSE